VSLALDRLLDTVADVAKDMRDEGTKAIRSTSIMLIGGSFFIAFLNLFFTRPRTPRRPQDGESPEPALDSLHPAMPLQTSGNPQHPLRS
jgi:hypothetical protein